MASITAVHRIPMRLATRHNRVPTLSRTIRTSASCLAASASTSASKKTHSPLLPSVAHLLREHGLDLSVADEIKGTGPNNRLLKGDVLAHVGKIDKSYPAELSTKISKLSHLDLSNIKLAPAAAPKKASDAAVGAAATVAPREVEIAVPVSMDATLEVQKNLQATLGIFMPLTTFISRAVEAANGDLPRSKTRKPSTNELFDQVLGLKSTTPNAERGNYRPQIAPLMSSEPVTQTPDRSSRPADIYDVLTKTTSRGRAPSASPLPRAGLSSGMNLFSVKVPEADENRAGTFLDRIKVILEEEPGRLVL